MFFPESSTNSGLDILFQSITIRISKKEVGDVEKEKFTVRDWFFGPARNALVEFFRSLVVGGIAFIVDAGLLIILKEFAGMTAFWASIVSFIFGLVVNYVLSVFWVFRQSNVSNPLVRFAIFTACALVGMALNSFIIWLFDVPFARHLIFGTLINPKRYYIIGKIVATVVVFIWNFLSRKLLLFRGKKNKEQPEAPAAG